MRSETTHERGPTSNIWAGVADRSTDSIDFRPPECASIRVEARNHAMFASLLTRRLAPATALLLINSRHRRAIAATKQPAGAKLLRADPRCQAADVQ